MKSILLVDDETEVVTFMERFLHRWKIPAIVCTSGEEALERYDPERISMVFLDIHMFKVDGFAVLKHIIQIDPGAKVIMITGRSDTDSQAKAKELGAIDYICKPVELKDLKLKIDTYLL